MSGKRYLPELREAARELRESGWTQRAIAEELGVSRDTVRAWTIPARGKRSGKARRLARERT